MHPYVQSLIGGGLIGAASAGLLLVNGRVAGVSGILGAATAFRPGAWRWAFLAGLLGVGVAARLGGLLAPAPLAADDPRLLLAAGLLVGVGTQIGSGCTSGHGVCGLSNLSLRSLAATATFMIAAAATVFLARHGGGLSWGRW